MAGNELNGFEVIKRAIFFLLVLSVGVLPSHSLAAASEKNFQKRLQELVEYVDKSMQRNVVQGVVSSAGVVIVHKDKTIFKKGYGYHDWGNKKPIDLQNSLFEVGSNSKVFTTLGILNLFDQGKINSFDDSANKYLRSMILPTYQGKEVTIHQLMTHTSGFEAKVFGMQVGPDTNELELQDYVHGLVREPGKYNSYSNFNIGTLGIIIEDITGLSYKEYMEQEIFRPLGMSQTTIWNTVGNPLIVKPRYDYRDYFSYSPMSRIAQASNGMVTSINDMESFLKMNTSHHLKEDLRLVKIMNERMSVYSTETLFKMVYPWWHSTWNGNTIFTHGGLANGTFSQSTILKSNNVGMFWVYQSLKASLIETRLYLDSLEILFGSYNIPIAYEDKKPSSAYIGDYRAAARAVTTSESILELLGQQEKTIEVNLNKEGDLVLGAEDNVLHKIGEDRFCYGNSNYFSDVSFQFEEDGKVNMLLSTFLYEKVDWFDNPINLRRILNYIVIAIFVTYVFAMMIKRSGWLVGIIKAGSSINIGLIIIMALVAFDGIGYENRLIIDLIQSDSSRLVYLALASNIILITTLGSWGIWCYGVYATTIEGHQLASVQWIILTFCILSLFSAYILILSRFNLLGALKI